MENEYPLITIILAILALVISIAIRLSEDKRETEEYAKRKGVTVEEIRELRTKRRERKIPEFVKTIVYKRDGGECRYCGSTHNIEYDHIYPFSKGGSSRDVDNIQLLLGHSSTKTTEIYTHVANRSFMNIKDLLS